MIELSKMISTTAKEFGIAVKACCEKSFLFKYGIEQANCIDRILVESICGYSLDIKRDKNQRDSCGCFEMYSFMKDETVIKVKPILAILWKYINGSPVGII